MKDRAAEQPARRCRRRAGRARQRALQRRRDERKAEPHRDVAGGQNERRHHRLAPCAPRCRRFRHRSGSSARRSAASSPASSRSTSATDSASSPKPPPAATGTAPRATTPTHPPSPPTAARARASRAPVSADDAAERDALRPRQRRRQPRLGRGQMVERVLMAKSVTGKTIAHWPAHAELAARIMVSGPSSCPPKRARTGRDQDDMAQTTWRSVNRRGGDRRRRPGRADGRDCAGRGRHRDRADRAPPRRPTIAPLRCWRVP